MPSFRSSPNELLARLSRGLLAVFVGLAVMSLLTERHSTASEHSPLDGAQVIFTGASHPALPTHLEPSPSETREPCSLCLLQLQSAGRLLPPPVVSALAPTPSHPTPAERIAYHVRTATPASPRAPPAAPATA